MFRSSRFSQAQLNEFSRLARERANSDAAMRWPIDKHKEREREADDLYIRYYREYTGCAHDPRR